jgi:clumping factor A
MRKLLFYLLILFNATNFYAQQWESVGPRIGIGSTYKNALEIGSDNLPYVVFRDEENGYLLTVKRYNNGGWETLGTVGLSNNSQGESATLAIDSSNVPYVFYSDNQQSGRATVQRFLNGAWEIVGNSAFSSGRAQRPTIAIDPNNIPYVIYDNYTGSNNLVVRKFVNNTWEMVGAYNFTGPTADIDIAFSSDATPYLAYQDGSNGYKDAVQRFVNGNWERVGTSSQSAGYAYGINIVLNTQNIPYVTFRDSGNSDKATVIKYVNNSWELVGSNGFTPSSAIYASLAISSDGSLYIAYKDGANGSRLTVQKFVNNNWEVLDAPAISTFQIDWPTIKVASDGTVYTAYYSTDYSDFMNMTREIFVKSYLDNALPVFSNLNSFEVQEGTLEIGDINAADIDGDVEGNGINYALTTSNGGEDNDFVTIDSSTGQLSFNNALNFESPEDANGDNNYEIQVTATDSQGGLSIQNLKVTITNINELQLALIESQNVNCFGEATGSAVVEIAEGNADYIYEWSLDGVIVGNASGRNVVQEIEGLIAGLYTVTVTDAEDDSTSVNFPILQPQAALNVLATATPESMRNAYDGEIWLEVSGGKTPYNYSWSNGATTQNIIGLSPSDYDVTVTDANDCSINVRILITTNQAPSITTTANINLAENQTSVLNVEATDPEGETEGNTIVYSLTANNSGGADNPLFQINANTGELTFIDAPDYENPIDTDNNNTYLIQVTVSDSFGATEIQDLVITVNDIPNDFDEDGLEDSVDTDDDNDGTPDSEDKFPLNNSENTDFDNDGTGDNADTDDDNDGTPDTEDAFPLDDTESLDADGDGIGNNTDPDDDNDGILDEDDEFPLDGTDTDMDGIPDSLDTDDDNDGVLDQEDDFPLDSSENADFDNDGLGDNLDTDDDNDGTPDSEDAFPFDGTESYDADGDGIGNNTDPDDDNDGILDEDDDFPLDGTDTDMDGIPDSLDTDDDNDGVLDQEDNFPLDNSESTDFDNDGLGDNLDTDDDNDGTPDSEDGFPFDDTESFDTDGDGIGNNTDPDDDNDGIPDENDTFPFESEPSVRAAEAFTPNGDGINDSWIIPGIDNYPNNLVQVYNRTGRMVFEAKSYQNNWSGFYNENREKLPAGSYLYVINLGNGEKPLQGWIFINY